MAKKKGGGGGGGGGGGPQQPKPPAEGDEKSVVGDDGAKDDKTADKAGKKAPPVVTAVLKMDMHCDGCAKRIRASVRQYPGVEGVAMDVAKGTMTVVGRLDAKKLSDHVAKKTRKKVDLAAGNNNKQDNKGKKDGDGEASNKKQMEIKPHEYGLPVPDFYPYHYYWLDKMRGGAGGGCKPPENKAAQQDNKDKPCGGGGKGNKEEKASAGGGGGGEKGKDKDDKASAGGGGVKGKDGKKPPAVPVVGTVVLKIGGMGLHCDGCMNRVRTKLFKIKGVEQVTMEMGKNQVTVTGTMDVKALPGKLQKKIRRPVDVAPASKDKQKETGSSSKQDGKQQEGGGQAKEKDKDKDAATKQALAEMELWRTAFYDQRSLLNAELMLSDENPNACSVM